MKRKSKCFSFFLDVSDAKKINTDMFQYALKNYIFKCKLT